MKDNKLLQLKGKYFNINFLYGNEESSTQFINDNKLFRKDHADDAYKLEIALRPNQEAQKSLLFHVWSGIWLHSQQIRPVSTIFSLYRPAGSILIIVSNL
jgi:hypothetical protein